MVGVTSSAVQSGTSAMATAGAVRSIVKVTLTVATLPAQSVAVATRVWEPSFGGTVCDTLGHLDRP
jgi:hypothetical protein